MNWDVIMEMELRNMKKEFKPFVFIILILIIWYVVASLKIVSAYALPSPQKVFTTFLSMLKSGVIFRDVIVSFKRVVHGFSIAFLLAFILGMITFLKPKLSEYYDFLIQFFRNVPPLSLTPLLILWCGIGETTKIVIIILASFFPMYLNIVKGFTSCDTKLLEVGDMFDFSPLKKFFKITLPNAIGDILIGMRVGLGYSFRAIIGAEMIAASSGLGYSILFAQQTSRTDKVIVGIITIGLVGYFFDKLFGKVISKYLKGDDQNGWN